MNMLTKWNPLGKSGEPDMWRPIMRWDPLREMEELMRGMQRSLAIGPAKSEPMELTEWCPSVDIGENDKEFVVKAELPEVKKEDIKVSVEDGTICISGERRVEKEETHMKYHRVERAYGHFERTFGLPEQTDPKKITSEYKDGILTVHLPKNPDAKPATQRIPVN